MANPKGFLIQNWQDAMVYAGLGEPRARAFVAGIGATSLLYATGMPHAAFREDGSIKPFGPLSPGPDGVTAQHFLVLPVLIATGVYLFT